MSELSNIERVSEEIVDFIKNGSPADNNAEAYTVTDRGKSGTLAFGNYRYTRWGDGVGAGNEELYNHSADPGELENLVTDATHKKYLEDMRKRFDAAKNKSKGSLNQ